MKQKIEGGKKEFNGYDFDNKDMRKRMKYLVVFKGDLDINGAYAFRTKGLLRDFLKSEWRDVEAIFEIKDITNLNKPL